MILEQKKLWFKKAFIVLEDDIVTPELEKKYSSIVAVSYKKLDLPGWRMRTKTTALIGLMLPEDEIFSKFSDTTRNEIRKTLKNEDFESVGGSEWFEQSYGMYREFEFSQKRTPVSKNELGMYEFFGVTYKGELVSGMYVICSGTYLRLRSIFSKRLLIEDKDLYKAISNASRRTMWDICRWGKERGYASLDLASVNFENPKTANITKFKMSFGGEVIEEHTHIYKSPAFAAFERLAGLKIFITKLLRRA